MTGTDFFPQDINYRNILDAMTESIWIGDSQERTVYANPNFCRLLGYELEEMLGKESYVFWDEESAKTVKNNNKLRKKGESSKYEWILKSKTGEKIPVLLSGTPLPNGGTAGIMTDLREIRAVREEAHHFQELNKIKDEFIAMVGHELRTPMTGIRGYLSMIADGDAGPITPQTEKFLSIVLTESNRLIDMINDMLDIAKLESGKMEFHDDIVSILSLCEDITNTLKFTAENKQVTLSYSIPPKLRDSSIQVDSAKIKQVIINLIGNAIKFTPAQGSVTLSIEDIGDRVEFHIRDTGIGIPEEHLESIFEKFKQVDNYLQKTANGTGLGLYICQQILAHYSSHISVTSKLGEGSDFFFSILLTPQG